MDIVCSNFEISMPSSPGIPLTVLDDVPVDSSATYEKLARSLVAFGKRNIAEAMCTARGIMTTIECSCILECMYFVSLG